MTDEIIKTGLDRKTRVQAMKDRNCYQTTQSLAHVERSRSPARSMSRSPLRTTTNMQAPAGGNSLTEAYLSHNRNESKQQSSQIFDMGNQASLKEMCRQQLQENLRQHQASKYDSLSSQP